MKKNSNEFSQRIRVFLSFFSRYFDHVRQERVDERAGGYTREYPCLRAVQEAFDMLLFVKEDASLAPVKQEPMTEAEAMEN